MSDPSQWETVPKLLEWLGPRVNDLEPMIVDIGASDGFKNSNSWHFVRNLRWKALYVEPNPIIAQVLRVRFPDQIVEQCAVGADDGWASLYVPNDHQCASLTPRPFRFVHQVPIRTPEYLLSKHAIRRVGILTVDTEGFDWCVLVNWMKYTEVRPQIVITESWPWMERANEIKRAMLQSKGYTKALQCGENEVFEHGI